MMPPPSLADWTCEDLLQEILEINQAAVAEGSREDKVLEVYDVGETNRTEDRLDCAGLARTTQGSDDKRLDFHRERNRDGGQFLGYRLVPVDTSTPTARNTPVIVRHGYSHAVGGASPQYPVRWSWRPVRQEQVFSRGCHRETFRPAWYRSSQARVAGRASSLARDGLVVTNEHVVDNARTVRVWLTNGRYYEGDVLERDKTSDLALVKIGGQSAV